MDKDTERIQQIVDRSVDMEVLRENIPKILERSLRRLLIDKRLQQAEAGKGRPLSETERGSLTRVSKKAPLIGMFRQATVNRTEIFGLVHQVVAEHMPVQKAGQDDQDYSKVVDDYFDALEKAIDVSDEGEGEEKAPAAIIALAEALEKIKAQRKETIAALAEEGRDKIEETKAS